MAVWILALFFNGSIDEVAFFSSVLDLADIQALMNNGIDEVLNPNSVSPGGKSATTWASIKDQY